MRIIRQRLHPWSCSKLANYIRGQKKPNALEWREWDEWHDNSKKNHPLRYWLAETGLSVLQNTIYFPYDLYTTISSYIKNRWIYKTHCLKTGLQPGYYYEMDERILYGLFNELVDFVEIELAHLSLWDCTKQYKFKHGRCVDAAYDYFKWASKLKDIDENGKKVLSNQAKDARKIKKLYEWWKNIRPRRKNPHDLSGWSDEYNKIESDNYQSSKNTYRILLKLDQIEKSYDKEDEDMLIELIRLRKSLWS